MCNSPSCDHRDLDDSIGDLFTGEVTREEFEAGGALANAQQYKMHEERCKACSGRGRFISYAGRDVGPCFKCKGKGVRYFRQSLEQRAKQTEQRHARKERTVATWAEANAADFAWMTAKAGSFDFATSMLEALNKYGSLTERQHATVTRLRLADAERTAKREIEAAQRAEAAPVVSLDKIEQAFAAAQANSIKRPKLRLDTFKFSLAPAHGRNAGAIYVVDADSDQYLGKIAQGKFFRVRECSDDQEARIVAVAADPKAAAIAYGQRTGNCCICGRELTNSESIDLGIGPICAGRMGW